jgi:hypothetical protein
MDTKKVQGPYDSDSLLQKAEAEAKKRGLEFPLDLKLSFEVRKLTEKNESLKKELEDQEMEFRKFRGAVARGNGDCVYCGLSKDDMIKCAHGFPGCGRADDITDDPNFNPFEGYEPDITKPS